jgi:hypothetical protein
MEKREGRNVVRRTLGDTNLGGDLLHLKVLGLAAEIS